jgi:protein KTI12
VSAELSKKWNDEREERYSEETLVNLIQRFEEPSYKTKWDTPLFIVQHDDRELPMEDIEAALFGRLTLPPNLSTVVVRMRM